MPSHTRVGEPAGVDGPAGRPGGSASVGEPAAGRSPLDSWQVIAALVVVVLGIGVVAILGHINKSNPVISTGPLPIVEVGQPDAATASCHKLMPALPQRLANAPRRTLEGQTVGVAAWGDPAVILRCGLETPAELVCSSALVQVGDVSWLQLPSEGLGDTTYLAADRSVRIAVTVPDGSGTGPIQQISEVVNANLPVRPPCSDGLLLPTGS